MSLLNYLVINLFENLKKLYYFLPKREKTNYFILLFIYIKKNQQRRKLKNLSQVLLLPSPKTRTRSHGSGRTETDSPRPAAAQAARPGQEEYRRGNPIEQTI